MSTEQAAASSPQIVYYCPAARAVEQQPGGGFDTCCHAPELHEPILPTVVAAIRQQVAEEIAAKLDDCAEGLKRTADHNRQRSIDLVDRSTYVRECLMRMAVSQNNRAQGIRDAAEVVREIALAASKPAECSSCHTRDGHPHTEYCKREETP